MRSVTKIFIITGIALAIGNHAFSASRSTYIKGVYSLPLSLDPIKMNDTASQVAGNLIYDGLLKFSPTLKIEGAIAESWTTSKDGKVLTFNLKKNAKFHDGSVVTSEDVVASLKRTVSPESKVRKFYDCIEGVEESGMSSKIAPFGIIARSKQVVEIHLKHPFPPFLSVLAGATAKILPAKQISEAFFQKPIGSGAFKFVSLSSKDHQIVLEAFDEYFAGRPKIDTFILKESDEQSSLDSAQNGKIHDLANWPLTGANQVFNFGKKVSSPVAATWIIGLNLGKVPFNSIETRKTFTTDVDTEGFRNKFYPDAFPAFGYIPFGLAGSEKSKQITSLEKRTVSGKEIKIAIPIELSDSADMKVYLEKNLISKGWKVTVVPMPWEKLMEGYVKKTHQAFLVSMNMDYPDAEFLLKNFESNNPDNFSGFKNEKFDSILKESRKSQDRHQRDELYKTALKIIKESAVTVNLFHPKAHYWISNCVEGFEPNILSDVYIDYSKISLKDGCENKVVATK